jgi:hypothetical protein
MIAAADWAEAGDDASCCNAAAAARFPDRIFGASAA